MNILAIESSCDETAAAVVRNGREILSNIIASQIEEHRIYGGVVPEIASRRHAEAISAVTREAIATADLTLADIGAIAVTNGPGLIGCLLVGVNFAKGLSVSASSMKPAVSDLSENSLQSSAERPREGAPAIPVVPVHHLRSHVAANYLAHPDLKPPFISLIVSGGHSHIVYVKDYCDFKIIGRTRDDAVGECYDKVARSIGLPYPGGVELDKLSVSGNPYAFKLPFPKVDSPFDYSFSGLKTAVVNIVHNAKQKGEALNFADLAASFQKTAVEVVITTLARAVEHVEQTRAAELSENCERGEEPLPLVLAGGVAANSALRAAAAEMCSAAEAGGKERKLYIPPLSLCGDNAAMVGAQGYYEFLNGNIAGLNLNAYATMNIES